MLPQFGDAGKLAPPFRLVVTYYVTSLAFFITGVFLTLVNFRDLKGFYFQPHILAITHILALGWITMIISGAMFQLIPVSFHVRVFSISMAYLQYFLLTLGTIGMAAEFYVFNTGVIFVVSASLAFVALVIFGINVLVTLLRAENLNITGYHYLTAMVFLLLAVSIGIVLALNLRFGFLDVNHIEILKVHAHVAIVGLITMVVFGAIYQLVPMFSLAYDFSQSFGWLAYFLTTLGLIGYGTAVVIGGSEFIAKTGTVFMAAGVFAFLVQCRIIFRKRMRKRLDTGLRQTVVSLMFLGAIAAIVIVTSLIRRPAHLSADRIAFIVGFLVFYGYAGMLVMGQMLKIGPFLTWLHKYSDKVGIRDVPALHEMVDQRLARLQFRVWTAGVPTAALGMILRDNLMLFTGCAAMFAASAIFLVVQYKIFLKEPVKVS